MNYNIVSIVALILSIIAFTLAFVNTCTLKDIVHIIQLLDKQCDIVQKFQIEQGKALLSVLKGLSTDEGIDDI